MAWEDKVLLERWTRQRDGEAFRTLVWRYGGMVHAACRRILGNSPDAEDVAQECFEALAAAGSRPGSYVGAWLHRVATHHAISRVRREVRRKKREQDHAPRPAHEASLEWKDIYVYVDEAVNELPDKLRVPLIAHYLEGQTKEAIGRALGLSRQAASYRIERGLKEVRAALRRKGAYLGVGLLATLMEAHAVEAPPAALMAKLGKIALTGPGAAAPVAASAAVPATACAFAFGRALSKAVGGVAVLGLMVGGLFFGWKYVSRPYPTQDITEASTFSVAEHMPLEARMASTAADEASPDVAEHTAPVASATAVQTLEPGTIVYGVVLDEDHRPVPGAMVTLDNREERELNEREARYWGDQWVAAAEIDLSLATNAQGEFFFERVVFPVRESLILAAHQGDRYAIKTIGSFGESRQRRHELLLAPAGLVKGRLVDEQNKGIPAVSIHMSPMGMYGEIRSFRLFTKEDGSFTSRPVPLGMYQLLISATGFEDPGRPWVHADGQTHVFQLKRKGPAGPIAGRVVRAEDGQPLAGVEVQAKSIPAVTDGNGNFQISDVPYGTHLLTLTGNSAPYVLASPVPVEVTSVRGVSGVELKAVRGASVTGRVVRAEDGLPAPQIQLSFLSTEAGVAARARTDAEGHYALTSLAAGTYTVYLQQAAEFKSSERPFTLPALEDMDGVDFVLDPLRAAKGTVVNSAGVPVAGASVVAIPTTNHVRLIRHTDAAGVFEIPLDAQIATVYLQAYGDGCVSPRMGPVRPGTGYVLGLEEAGSIEGVVVDTAGHPIPEAIVVGVPRSAESITVLSSDGSEWNTRRSARGTTARTSSVGAFEMEPILPGPVTLEVYLASSAPGYPVAETTARVQAGRTLHARLVVNTDGVALIEGRVTQCGVPLAYTIVDVYSTSGNWMADIETHTDANGEYVLSNVRAGQVRVTACEPGSDRRTMHRVLDLEEDEVRAVNFDFEMHGGGVEGYVYVNGVACQSAQVTAESAATSQGRTNSTVFSDREGYYRIANVASGTYVLRAYNPRSAHGSSVTMEATVEVGDEMVRYDFLQESGTIEGVVLGLREGEKAGVALFEEWMDPSAIRSLSMQGLEERMLTSAEVGAGEPFVFGDVPVGAYYLGVVALPGGEETSEWNIGDSLGQGRFAVQQVEVAANGVTAVEVAIP